jgi:hypothetical protein
MQAYKTETTIGEGGSLKLSALPFAPGERVEVIVLSTRVTAAGQTVYPLRGTSYRYDEPTEPVAEEDWEAVR